MMDAYDSIITLYRKLICSLACVQRMADDETLKKEASLYLDDFITQYCHFLEKGDIFSIQFKYTGEDIADFFYRCIEYKVDIVRLSEDVYYGFEELVEKILAARENHS